MRFRHDWPDATFETWLDAQSLTATDLRAAYLALETKRADLWTAGHVDSYRRDRYELDALYVRRLVQIKRALVRTWVGTGQLSKNGSTAARDIDINVSALGSHVFGQASQKRHEQPRHES